MLRSYMFRFRTKLSAWACGLVAREYSRANLPRTQEEEAFENGGEACGGAQPLPSVTGRRVMISRELLVYLAEPDQIDLDGFNLLGFWSRRGTDSPWPTTGMVTSPADMPYLAFLARLYHGVEATSCQAERNFFQRSPTLSAIYVAECLRVGLSA